MTTSALLIIIAVCAGLGYAVATPERRAMGAVLGALLGPIGVIVAAVIK